MSHICSHPSAFPGCDVVVQLPKERENTPIRLLQITDMQFIDATQRRTPDRLRSDEIAAWQPEHRDALCGDHIRSLIAQSRPDMIFITGDMVYGSFDDSGRIFQWFCDFMGSLAIPWAPVFGNHDNESAIGVDAQCRMLEEAPYCLFHRGNVTGNGNYTVGIAVGDRLVRVMHMLDSHGCLRPQGILHDQFALIHQHAAQISDAGFGDVPAFVAHHIPTEDFAQASRAKGYEKERQDLYTIGVHCPGKDGDFGCKWEVNGGGFYSPSYRSWLSELNAEAVFVGHWHNINTCIQWNGIRWVYGLKTGQYDYHVVGQLGGTLVTLRGRETEIQHLPALVKLSPYPGRAPMFGDIFAPETAYTL